MYMHASSADELVDVTRQGVLVYITKAGMRSGIFTNALLMKGTRDDPVSKATALIS